MPVLLLREYGRRLRQCNLHAAARKMVCMVVTRFLKVRGTPSSHIRVGCMTLALADLDTLDTDVFTEVP